MACSSMFFANVSKTKVLSRPCKVVWQCLSAERRMLGGSVAASLSLQVNVVVAKMTYADLLRHLNLTELPVSFHPIVLLASPLMHSLLLACRPTAGRTALSGLPNLFDGRSVFRPMSLLSSHLPPPGLPHPRPALPLRFLFFLPKVLPSRLKARNQPAFQHPLRPFLRRFTPRRRPGQVHGPRSQCPHLISFDTEACIPLMVRPCLSGCGN